MSDRFVWVLPDIIEMIHAEQLALHGGGAGLRDRGGLEAAIEHSRMAAHYDTDLDIAGVAALYAHSISKRHPFVDGNKRTGFAVSLLFLELNGLIVTASMDDRYDMMYGLAAGTLSENEFAEWLRANTAPQD
jgi:death-on-curing protein